ncbi:MAG TPA: hypothetical protein VHG33_05320 [Woeseiaceae bacterium]|nr:hypothetical protein [Woeseiaceae bacterium]
MRKSLLRRLCVPAAAAAALALVAGCVPFKDWLAEDAGPDARPIVVGSETPSLYVQEMYELASGDPVTQAEIYADASAAASLTPDPVSRLRFALVLATPGHTGSDPERARDMLRSLLSQPELLTPVERSLAVIHLQNVEERLVLGAEARRLQAENSRAERTEEAAVAQRIAAVEAENRQLRQSLAEAEEKLEAITTIERSIREQSDNNNSNR